MDLFVGINKRQSKLNQPRDEEAGNVLISEKMGIKVPSISVPERKEILPRNRMIYRYLLALSLFLFLVWIFVFLGKKAEKNEEKFLLILPWEQLNNQMLCIISGCAVANMTGRTLVIPDIGYKQYNGSEEYRVTDFVYNPFESYFDGDLMQSRAPCRTVLNSKFLEKKNPKRVIDTLIWNKNYLKSSLGENLDYYEAKQGMKVLKSEMQKMMTQHSEADILSAYAHRSEKFLAVGSMFMFYSFGVYQPFPIERNYDYMVSARYSMARYSLQPRKELIDIAKNFAIALDGMNYMSIHIRKGDYLSKCGRIMRINPLLQKRCMPSDSDIEKAIQSAMNDAKTSVSTLYISTNAVDEISDLVERLGYIFPSIITLHNSNALENVEGAPMRIDPVEEILLDQLICTYSTIFVGNIYSSFTRTISDWRFIYGKTNDYF